MIPCESLMTFLAFEWLLSRVGSLVVLKHVFVSEGSVAHPAGEHLLPAAGVAVPAPAPRGRGPVGGRGLGLRLAGGQAALEAEVGRARACEEASGGPGRGQIALSLIAAASWAGASPE